MTEEFDKQPLTQHLADLRHALILSLSAVAVGFAVSYGFIKQIGQWFFKPLIEVLPAGTNLIFISYQEAFFFI
jgi:sec-independent protein translocase protein TatC